MEKEQEATGATAPHTASHSSFMELLPRSRGQEESLAAPLGPRLSPQKRSSFSVLQQQNYSAATWLRRQDKLEQMQQKCIVTLAQGCCFAMLVALMFSALDLWGDGEDRITEDNCSRDCQIVLVENIPDDLSLLVDGRVHLPLSVAFHILLDQAKHSVEVMSPVWNLNLWNPDERPGPAEQGQRLFQKLLSLKSRGVQLKIVSTLTDSAELKTLAEHNAEVMCDMTVLTRGELRSSFWIVTISHLIGSAVMDWRALSKRKELGLALYNCSCLALDLHRVFSFYWQLHQRDYIPSIWAKRVTALYSKHDTLELQLNATQAAAYVSASPEVFCPKARTRDVDAIYQVIQSARTFVFVSVTDYLPLVNRSQGGASVMRYWSCIDDVIREAVVVRGVRVRLLISFWKNTHPLTFNFVTSLKSLCMQLHNCSVEVRFFSHTDQKDGDQFGLNHKYVVTDSAVYIGNHNWVGTDFSFSAGVGLVLQMKPNPKDRSLSILEHIRAAFERDWSSTYATSSPRRRGQEVKLKKPHQMKFLQGQSGSSPPAGGALNKPVLSNKP
ncbi:LOW QUALITY PROTEIN: inactive phospholipase D5-like [Thalassophryne amazonica]|uniref:LOW QUALITY PROTEIN: inactive phospholipase D5-like n=1 Tax=Thalassophryne amazonica TaxID=390379 RepID=UPI001472390D|nr:LOW QUALITY PROTEIN: inactive phospholipase D5-like [Thalassophryne amazonica]